MSQIEEIEALPINKGCVLRLFVDYAQPEDSVNRQWTEVTYDGEEDSFLFNVPPHWHKYHDELMTVLSGKLEIMVEGKTQVVEADPSQTLRIPRWQIHGITAIKGVPLKLKERTNPTGDFKGDFFRDLLSQPSYPPPFLFVMRAFYDGDTFPALPLGIKLLDQIFVNIFGGIAKLVLPARDVNKKGK